MDRRAIAEASRVHAGVARGETASQRGGRKKLVEKTAGIPDPTIGVRMDRLNKLLEHGASDDTPVEFEMTCVEVPGIRPLQTFDEVGELIVEKVIIR